MGFVGLLGIFVGLVTIAVATVWSSRAWGPLSAVVVCAGLLLSLLILPFSAYWLWLAAMGVGAVAQKARFAQIANDQ